MYVSIRSFARHSGYNRYWDYRELAIHKPSVNLSVLPPTSYLCTQATVAASVSGSAGTKEVKETSAPVDLRTHPPPAHAERAVTTASVTHSFRACGYNRPRHALHSRDCFSFSQVLEVAAAVPASFECGYCKLQSPQQYRCKPCASKLASLCKLFVQWPPRAFEDLSEDLKVAFWRSDSRSKNSMMKDLEVTITKVQYDQEVSRKLSLIHI